MRLVSSFLGENFGAPVAFDAVDAGTTLLIVGVVVLATLNGIIDGRAGVPTPGEEAYAAAVVGLGGLTAAASLLAGPTAHWLAAGGVLAGGALVVLGALSTVATVD